MHLFNRSTLKIKSLSERKHGLDISAIRRLKESNRKHSIDKKMLVVSECIIRAIERKSAVILMIGGHVIRAGVQNYIIDLMKRGYVSCIAMNGAGIIHDFEFASIGATTESVARYIKEGQFGLWKETGVLNDIINESYSRNKTIGMGEAVGQYIEEHNLPYKAISILACGCRLNIPITVHVGIGYDIIHEHPNCNGATTGALSYNDFLKFVSIVQRLEHGVVMNFGSSIMGPEVFLKALSMARNIARQHGRQIKRFTSLVCDIVKLPNNFRREPSRDDAGYYFRPWKTMLVRTVADGGEGFYVKGRHEDTIPSLWASLNELEAKVGKTT